MQLTTKSALQSIGNALALGMLFLAIGCENNSEKGILTQPRNSNSPPVPAQVTFEKPVAPLTIPEPPPQSEFAGEVKISELAEGELAPLARAFASQQKWALAAQYQYWAVKKSGHHQYDLACYLARLEQLDAAFYWLQVAGVEDGVDHDWARKDADLKSLRADPRWEMVHGFLKLCEKYWESKTFLVTTVILPTKYDGKTPLTTIVGLHGLGSNPEDLVNDGMQRFADELNVAFVGVSGTIPRGKSSFVWSEDPERDHQHIVKALESVKDRLNVNPGHVITIGFSQGAQAGLEAAVRHPDFYAGAIVMSPGNRAGSKLKQLTPIPDLSNRRFVFVVGDRELKGNIFLTMQDADWARSAGANIIHRLTSGQSEHTFPSDFNDRLPQWIKFIENAGNGK